MNLLGVVFPDATPMPAVHVVLPGSFEDWATHIGPRLADVAIFGLLGIALLIIGFKLFDMMLPKLHFQGELGPAKNVALAIVIGAYLLAISIIMYAAMHG